MRLQDIIRKDPLDKVFALLDRNEKYFEDPTRYNQIKLDYTDGKAVEADARRRLCVLTNGKNWEKIAERQELLDGLQARYSERLDKKLNPDNKKAAKFELKLSLEMSRYDLDEPANKPKAGMEIIFDELYKHYERSPANFKRVAVIGEPGAGKTVILLKFALELLKKARTDADCPIPIILNLATWRTADYKDFADWLQQNLRYALGRTGTSPKNAKDFFASDELRVWLLDGLDEVPESDRLACVEAVRIYMAKFHEQAKINQPEYIFCCRRQEYEALEKVPQASACVLVNPLTPQEVERELQRLSALPFDNATRLLRQTQANKKLTTAFEVGIALDMAGDSEFRLENIKNTPALVEAYIAQEVKGLPARATDWLSFLAYRLQASKKRITFELIDVQIEWIKQKKIFLVFCIFFNLLGRTLTITNFLCMDTQIFTCLSVSIIFICLVFFNSEKKMKEYYGFLKEKYLKGELKKLEYYSFHSIKELIDIFSGYSKTQTKISFMNFRIAIFVKIFIFIFTQNIFLLFIFLDYKELLVLSVISSSFLSFFMTLSKNKTIIKHNVYTKVSEDLIYQFFYNLSFMIIFYILSSYYCVSCFITKFLMVLAISTLISSMFFVNYLMFCFAYYEGSLPFRLVSFLRKVEKTGLMERDGGQWRFRHQLIQDTLAEKYKSPR